MRKLIVMMSVVLLSVSMMFVFAQEHQSVQPVGHEDQGHGHDDHDDGGPIQAGYAVVTPSSSTSQMAVFATFGMRRGPDAIQAGVIPASLTTNAVLFVDASGRLSKNLGVAIVNPSSSSVNVTLTLRKTDGTELAKTVVSVPARQQTSKFVTELFANHSSVPKELTGTLSITSPTPISVIGLRFRGPNFSTLPVTSLSAGAPIPSIATGIGGTGSVLLPQFAAGGGWATEIVIANTGTSSMTVRVDLFKQDGTALTASLNGTSASSFTNIVVPAGGVFVLAPRDDSGDDDF